MKYRTRLHPVLHNTHNNVKTDMILSMISRLEQTLSGPEVVFRQLYADTRKESSRPVPKHKLLHVDDLLTLPCLNTNCVWVKYMSTFHRSKPVMQLPAFDPEGHCFVCARAKEGLLDMSCVRLTEDLLVFLE